LASALTDCSRGGRTTVRAPQRMPWTWMAFPQTPFAISDVETIVPWPVRSR
jgi:hypothetical protein